MAERTAGDLIREVREAHLLETESRSVRFSLIEHHAGCSCDPEVEFEWYAREALHREHVDLAIFDAGKELGRG